ncbi:site-specific DNA-methyltransferase [Pontixanthobacter luteolus]|uniref:site-specific DNA-methyltransferase n=1 Tax=Pontixanthobacter luteolus TaxID=295089 RepID=UPI00230230DB|nr:site-specific DNA-methyltransferase [Pontixanthobacter luteolus]
MTYEELPRSALIKLLQENDAALKHAGKDGIVLNYSGRTAPWQITRLVKPKLSAIIKKYSVGSEAEQCLNEIWDGENLSAMVSLFRHRGKVDLIVTDPPYNTGSDFRYNDRWDEDPNDPNLGELVSEDDGSRHSKWLKFMTPRLWMMKEMLKPGGVLAICIDSRELYRLGILLDEIFHEENRLAILNWQKTTAPRSDKSHVSTSTEYVLVYAKDLQRARTLSEVRSPADNRRYGNIDEDPNGSWREGNLTARSASEKDEYGIQSPFTGEVHYPAGQGSWRHPKRNIRKWLEEWGTAYVEKDIGDGQAPALILKGGKVGAASLTAKKRAKKKLEEGPWPFLWFGMDGSGRPRVKTYLEKIKKGKVPVTYWAEEDDGYPATLDATSWGYKESGRTNDGVSELTSIVGPDHGFTTVKPLKLISKIIQIWCPIDGLVMDPFAGSGTTAHAVLKLNKEQGADRRFILVEQGNDENNDPYARTLTAARVKAVIKGDWASGKQKALGGGFRFINLRKEKIDADAVNALAREEMIDLLLNSYWDKSEKARTYLHRYPIGEHQHLFATNPKNEGFYLIWAAPDCSSVLDRSTFKEIVREAEDAGLASKYHVYASLAPYTGAGIEFYKIPERVLEHIGFNARSDAYSNEKAADD